MRGLVARALVVVAVASCALAQTDCIPADGNGDGVVNVVNILALLGEFGGAGSYDIDGFNRDKQGVSVK